MQVVAIQTTEFRSALEDLVPAKELIFPSTLGFGPYRNFFPKEAVGHPAKINLHLLEYLIKNYSRVGDNILDPMSGTGSTACLAALHGRNGIAVELEPKFVKWIREAAKTIAGASVVNQKGQIKVIKGDARKLSKILSSVDSIITSPPYSKSLNAGGHTGENNLYIKIQKSQPKSPPINYSDNPDNIGNLKHGKIDSVITSPPYAESLQSRGGTQNNSETMKGNKPHPYSKDPTNIGNMKYFDSVITSPPYSGTLSRHSGGEQGKWNKSGIAKKKNLPANYSQNDGNIGNLPINSTAKKQTYLEAMSVVYSEVWKVLKPGGCAVIVVKSFTSNKQNIDLPYQTWTLMERVGFQLEDLIKFRLPNLSFWRVLQYRRNPEIPQIRHEYAIVVRKPV